MDIMKRVLMALALAFVVSACVDENLDLGKVDADNITIGTDESVFEMPLATLTVKTSALHSGEIGIEEVFEEVNIWLPATLPAGADYVDLQLLESNEGGYRDNLIDALLLQMETDLEKRRLVANHLEEDYAASFDDLLPAGSTMSISDFIYEHYDDEGMEEYLHERIDYLAHDYLMDVATSVDSVDCNIGSIGLDSSVIDMLTHGIGTRENPSQSCYLALYGTINSKIPVDVHSWVNVDKTGVVIELDVHHNQMTDIPESRVYADDLRQMVMDTHLIIPIGLDHYYPNESFPSHNDMALTLTLSLRKKGGLAFEF